MARINLASNFWNCKIYAKNYGTYYLVVDTLGYGLQIATKPDGTTRRERVFYPYVRTSGTWYVNAVFSDYEKWRKFQNWMFGYVARATDPHDTVQKPMTVTVSTENFEKVGYPVSTIDFGNEWDKMIYSTSVSFASASDPETMSTAASRFVRPTNDHEAATFYPGGFQSTQIPRPVPPANPYDSTNNNDGGTVLDGIANTIFGAGDSHAVDTTAVNTTVANTEGD